MVELDDGLTQLAYRFFGLRETSRLRIFHTDGRTFLKEYTDTYDIILVDAFTHTKIPRDLKTIEAVEALCSHLLPKGIVAMNVISGYKGASSQVLRELSAAFCQVFETVDIFLASRGYSLWLPQNFVLTAQKGTDYPLKDYVRYSAVQLPEVGSDEALSDS